MHELSIAISIIEGAAEEAEKHPGERVDVIHLRLGALSGVVKEALLFSYNLACEGTQLEGSRLEIEETPAAINCNKCNCEREVDLIQALTCPVCLTPSAEVVRGRELSIIGLELINEYAAAAG